MNERDRQSVLTYVALGSNLGRREIYLREAVNRLDAHPQVSVMEVSPVYESPAHTIDASEEQPPFLNAVAACETTLDPEDLLQFCHEIERNAGRSRNRAERWAPRTLDIDILVFGAGRVDAPALSIPHPRMNERRFVLRPLADIAPDLWIPMPHASSVRDLLSACPDPFEPVRTAHVLGNRSGGEDK